LPLDFDTRGLCRLIVSRRRDGPGFSLSTARYRYFRFRLSLRDIEELLFKRGVIVSYETIRRRCDKFGAGFAPFVKTARGKPGIRWHLDEVFVTLRGKPHLLWRAVDQHGAELDMLLQKRRNKAAAKRFFKRVLAACPDAPWRIVTDQFRRYPPLKLNFPNWQSQAPTSSKAVHG
jgi:putative transposase